MKLLLPSIFFLFITISTFAQTDIEKYVREGIEHHDKGEYDEAIDWYKKALKVDGKSALVNYEISMTYFAKGDYKNAVVHAEKVIEQKSDYMMQAYMTKGSSLDMLGKTKESISLFEKAIKQEGPHYLLFYNLGLNYYKIKDYKNAEANVIKAIENKPSHGSSHLILANIHHIQGNHAKALLPLYYFLLIEPNSKRSLEAYKMLEYNADGNVSTDPNKPNTININISGDSGDDFAAVELMVSMLAASASIEENENKTEEELFISYTESFIKIVGEMNDDKKKGIWWTLYTPILYDIVQSEHFITYCHYIRQSSVASSAKWIKENKEKLEAFDQWISKN